MSVGQETYLTLDKSPMHPQHVLLIPIEHYPSAVSLSPSARAEAAAYISSVRKFYQSQVWPASDSSGRSFSWHPW